jgi:hypothetical protein
MAGQVFSQQSKVDILQAFLGSNIVLDKESVNQQEPIVSISEQADKTAAKSIVITKDNIKAALAEAKNYKTSFIIVGRHTIVKITDLADCSQSGAWAACMPKGAGYIQKSGGLNEMEGYINYIIGIPDGQTRTLFLFR